MSAWPLIWQTPQWIHSMIPFPFQHLRISQNLYENLMTWFRSRLCCWDMGEKAGVDLSCHGCPSLHPFSFSLSSVPFSIFSHPFFHINIFHYVSPWSVFGLFQQLVLPLQLIGSGVWDLDIITNQFNLSFIRSKLIFLHLLWQDNDKSRIHYYIII